MTKPLMLIILDGWGVREESADNAIAQATTPHYDRLLADYPHSLLDASGKSVGLPAGIMGNSEVGHLNIGAGRIAKVGLTKIYQAIEDKSFFRNPALLKAFQAAKQNHSKLHLMGLVSDGAVHSHQDHLYALLQMAVEQGVDRVFIHAFLDGRDTDPKSGAAYLQALEEKIRQIGAGKVATFMGRYFAMDRDKRWDRIEQAYRAMVEGEGRKAPSSGLGIHHAYVEGETDEFVIPTVLLDNSAKPVGTIDDHDAVICFNFRADRAREMTHALTDESFSGFVRKKFPKLSQFVCMGEYDKSLSLPVAFPPEHVTQTFGEIIAKKGLKQLRIAETEKYAHVTFFFNGGEENVFPGEERILVPSPREVPTYDLKPEMSAPEITKKVLDCIDSDQFDVIILNFANADMVGHSGKLSAAIRAVEVLDEQIGKIQEAVLKKGGTLLITADHGNCEKMRDERGQPHTAHTTDLVPFIVISPKKKQMKLRDMGSLADIAPTMLQLMGLDVPREMSGKSMILS